MYSTSAVLRLRTEETGNLAEPVLSAATGRTRWALSHISVTVGGACLLLVAAGLSTGLGYGVLTGSVSTQVPRLLGAALARLPATIVVAAAAVLLFGLLPWESVALAWTAVALVGVIGVFGPPLQWPAWMMDISPFIQIPKLPGGTVSAASLLWFCAAALTISTAGLIGLRHRDLGDLGPPARSARSATGSSSTRALSQRAANLRERTEASWAIPEPGVGKPGVAVSLFLMTESPGPGPDVGQAGRPPGRRIVRSVLRAGGSTAALVVIYYLLPLDRSSTAVAVTLLTIGLVGLIGLVAYQVRSIIRSSFPLLRGVEALATSIPLFLLLFAATYVVLGTISAGNFSQPMSRTDAIYFTVTVFATVGFGDITAKTDLARLVVTGQMLADLVVIGLGVRVLLSAVQRGRQRSPAGTGTGPPGR